MSLNISVDAEILNAIDIADANAAAGDILVLFFVDGVNVFNKASESMGGAAGDIVVHAGVKYTVAVTPAEALLLNGTTVTYKLKKGGTANIGQLDSAQRVMEDINSGTVTVTNLPEGDEDVPLAFVNSNRQKLINADYDATADDDTILVGSATQVVVTLPDYQLMSGKRIRIKTLAGDVLIKFGGTTIATLTGELTNIELEAFSSIAWQTFK